MFDKDSEVIIFSAIMPGTGFSMAQSGALMRLTEEVFHCFVGKIRFDFIPSSVYWTLILPHMRSKFLFQNLTNKFVLALS